MNKPLVVVVGAFQNGKSTLVNCLLDDRMAQTGKGLATTRINSLYSYGEYNELLLDFGNGEFQSIPFYEANSPIDLFISWSASNQLSHVKGAQIKAWKPLLSTVDLLDTPGFNADSTDDSTAKDGLEKASYAIVVLNNKMPTQAEISVLDEINRRGLRYIVCMNCTSKENWHPKSDHNRVMAEQISSFLQNRGYKPDTVKDMSCSNGDSLVWPCNLLWFWMASGHYQTDPDRDEGKKGKDSRMVMESLNVEAIDWRQLALESNFAPIRQHLQSCPWQVVSVFKNSLLASIENAANVWNKGIQSALAVNNTDTL